MAAKESKWSWTVGRLFGIELRIHATFFILLAWIAIGHLARGHGAAVALAGTAFICAVFGIVVLHELGHALTARHFGVTTRSITLLPIGGVALLDRIPEKAAQELWIAVAGPAVNFVLAGLLFVVIRLLGMPAGLPATEVSAASFLPQLMWINLTLGLFNLLPAFPMDGGRIVRAALALKLEHRRATAIAARLGQIIAVALGIIGFLVNGMLMFVALFVWIGARQEAAQAKLKGALHGTRVKNAMITESHTVHPDDELGVVADRVVSGYQPDFPVVEQGRLVGMLTRWDLFSGIARLGRRAAVRDAMNRQPAVAAPLEPLEEVVDRLTEGASVLVLEGGALVGILTSENVGEWLMMKEAPRAAAA